MWQNFQASKTSPQFAISHADCCEINLLHLDLAMQRIQLFHWPTPKQSMQANVHKMCNLKPLMLKFPAKSRPNSSPIQCLLQHPGNKKMFSAVSCRPQECSHALEIERPPCLQQAKKNTIFHALNFQRQRPKRSAASAPCGWDCKGYDKWTLVWSKLNPTPGHNTWKADHPLQRSHLRLVRPARTDCRHSNLFYRTHHQVCACAPNAVILHACKPKQV